VPQACSRCGTAAGRTGGGLCGACLLRLAEPPASRLPDFQIETLLGSGPFGTTYLGRAADGSLLAAKKIAGEFSLGSRLDEAGARLAACAHACLATFHGLAPDDDGVVMVRGFVQGRPFREWISGAAAAERGHAFEQLLGAVDLLHARGLAHGHLAATNIVIARGNQVVLLDSGARLVADAVRGRESDVAAMRRNDLLSLAELREAAGR
jgi:serine/threonine protein kinase